MSNTNLTPTTTTTTEPELSIGGVWEVQFFLHDANGQIVEDENGKVRAFYSPHSDFSEMGLTENLQISQLREV